LLAFFALFFASFLSAIASPFCPTGCPLVAFLINAPTSASAASFE
jgi:hypothetical protein